MEGGGDEGMARDGAVGEAREGERAACWVRMGYNVGSLVNPD